MECISDRHLDTRDQIAGAGLRSRRDCQRELACAERELAAFVTAVRETHGCQAAEVAAEHWLSLLNAGDHEEQNPVRSLRFLTIRSASFLAQIQMGLGGSDDGPR